MHSPTQRNLADCRPRQDRKLGAVHIHEVPGKSTTNYHNRAGIIRTMDAWGSSGTAPEGIRETRNMGKF